MRRQWIGGLLLALTLAGCSSGGNKNQVDTRPPPRNDTGIPVDTSDVVDAGSAPIDADLGVGCDEDAMGQDYCIRNSAGGNPTAVPRQLPVPYQSCRL